MRHLILLLFFLPLFLLSNLWYPIGSYSLVSSLQLLYGLGRGEGREPRVLQKHNATKPHCFLTQRPSKPEASRTNVSEETLYTCRPCQRALCPACDRAWDSNAESLVAQLALHALDHCASLEAILICLTLFWLLHDSIAVIS